MRIVLAALALVVALPAWAAVDVASRATGGTGTATDPWTGWDTAIVWTADTEYSFRTGYFAYGRSPDFARTGLSLKGEAGARLVFLGEGNAVAVDGIASNVRLENLIILGNSSTRNGVFVRNARQVTMVHVSVRDVVNAGVWLEGVVGGNLYNVRVTHHEMPDDRFAVVPDYGLVFAAATDKATTNVTVVNPVVEDTRRIGIWIQRGAESITLINGTSEENRGKGIVVDGAYNTIINTDVEQNVSNIDFELSGNANQLIAAFTDQTVDVLGGNANRIRGRFHRIRIAAQATFTDISGAYMSGPLEDSGWNTVKYGYQTREGLQRGGRIGRGP